LGLEEPEGTAVEVGVEEWRKAMDINVLNVVLMSKYTTPEMLRTRPNDISRGTRLSTYLQWQDWLVVSDASVL